MPDGLVDLRPLERRVEKRQRAKERRDSFGRSTFRFLIVLLLTVIVLQLSEIVGLLQAIFERMVYG